MRQSLNDIIMLLDTELSRLALLLVGMDENHPERDVLVVIISHTKETLQWYKNTREALDEGRI